MIKEKFYKVFRVRFLNKRPRNQKKEFAIIGTMRSGSNLLQRVLDSYEGIFCHGELFNPVFIGFHPKHNNQFAGYARNDVEKRDENLDQFIEIIRKERKAKVLGYRIFETHHLFDQILNDRQIKKIILHRSYLDSYVSLKIAQQTNQWILAREEDRKRVKKISVDLKELEKYWRDKSRFYRKINKVLLDTNQNYLEISYDDVLDVVKVNSVAKALGSLEEKTKLEVDLVKQNPGTLKDKVTNYHDVMKFVADINSSGNAVLGKLPS